MLRASLLILALALPAHACLNDREITTAESEFRARYAGGAPTEAPDSWNVIIPLSLGIVGVVSGLLWWRRAGRG